uniref:Putative chaperonin n=1 Tax=viral metagenome TaxID=1070528 RepID=A0A6M3IKQ4_9ZZZZ
MKLEAGRILPGKVLVKEIPPVEKIGSIIIANVAKPSMVAGEVVLVGDDLPAMKMQVSPRDKILHSPHSFVNVEIEGEKYRLLNMQEILFIWRE